MVTSDERREVARMLRWFASLHGNVACVTVERMLNLDYSDGFGGGAVTSESVRRLADLIDPTCHPVPSDGGGFLCSECGERIGAVLPALGTVLMHHCSHCGARVVEEGER